MIPGEKLRQTLLLQNLKKMSFESFEKLLGDRQLQSQVENEEQEWQRRQTLTRVDIESKEQRRQQEESRGKFLSKLEKVVTAKRFAYYAGCSSTKD